MALKFPRVIQPLARGRVSLTLEVSARRLLVIPKSSHKRVYLMGPLWRSCFVSGMVPPQFTSLILPPWEPGKTWRLQVGRSQPKDVFFALDTPHCQSGVLTAQVWAKSRSNSSGFTGLSQRRHLFKSCPWLPPSPLVSRELWPALSSGLPSELQEARKGSTSLGCCVSSPVSECGK